MIEPTGAVKRHPELPLRIASGRDVTRDCDVASWPPVPFLGETERTIPRSRPAAAQSVARRSCPGCRLRHRRGAPACPGRDRARRYPRPGWAVERAPADAAIVVSPCATLADRPTSTAAPSRRRERARSLRHNRTARCTVRRCFSAKRSGATSIRRTRTACAERAGSTSSHARTWAS